MKVGRQKDSGEVAVHRCFRDSFVFPGRMRDGTQSTVEMGNGRSRCQFRQGDPLDCDSPEGGLILWSGRIHDGYSANNWQTGTRVIELVLNYGLGRSRHILWRMEDSWEHADSKSDRQQHDRFSFDCHSFGPALVSEENLGSKCYRPE